MAWNESPQSKILQFAQSLFPGSKVEVNGNRNTARGGKKPPYTAYLLVDGKVRATGQDRNWRTAYKTLQIAISKLNID